MKQPCFPTTPVPSAPFPYFFGDRTGFDSSDVSPKLGPSDGEDRRPVVLLVEDNQADVFLVEEAIAHHQLPVSLIVIDDGAKAFEYIRSVEDNTVTPEPDILLLDLNLPRRDGREVLQRLRQSPKLGQVPVIVITSSDAAKDRQEMAELGANRYFRKPSSYDGFLAVGELIEEVLREGGAGRR